MSLAARRRISMAEMLRNELEIEEADSNPSALSDIFVEEPPTLDVFIKDSQYLNNGSVTLGPLQYDFIRHFEQILYPGTYIAMVQEFGEYWNPVRFCNEYAIEWGKGSGKDFCCQLAFSRVSNMLLCLQNPQEYYDLSPHTYLHMLNVAASAPQAHSVFFKPMRLMITESPWFADKFQDDIKPSPQATEIRFKKQLELISGHSQASTLEGKNLIAGIADEISEFPTEDEVNASRTGRTPAKTAEAIVTMLKTSGSTRFPETYRLGQISFPRYKGDAIEQAISEGRRDIEEHGENSRFYVSGPQATWVVNPRYDKFEKIEIDGATQPVPNLPVFITDYKKNPAQARAKYECKPELAESRFFANDSLIDASFEQEIPPPIEFIYYWGTDETGIPSEVTGVPQGHDLPGWQVKFVLNENFRPMAGCLYAIHGDMAISGDKAGVAMCHVKNYEKRDWAIPGGAYLEQRPIVKVDFAHAFTSDGGCKPAPREVQIRWYRKLIWTLRSKGFEIAFVSFDNFQSADSLQILESWGIEAEKASTDRTPDLYNTLRDVMYDGRLEGYKHDFLTHEIRTLSLLKNGKIDHPPNGSKDIADALAGAVTGAVRVGGEEGEVPQFADDVSLYDNLFEFVPSGGESMSLSAREFGGFGFSSNDYGY